MVPINYDENIRNIKVAVQEAAQLIKAKHTGANLDAARSLLLDSGEALKANKFDKAIELAKKAQLAAKPSTDDLLQNAKLIAGKAESSFRSKNFEESIAFWKESLEEYNRAREIAEERGEKDVLERLEKVKTTLFENMTNAEVDQGNVLLTKAENKFDKMQFTEAENDFISALEYLDNIEFSQKEILGEIVLRGRTGLINSKIGQGKEKIKVAEDIFKSNDFSKTKGAFRSVREYLEEVLNEASSFGLDLDDINGLIQVCTTNISRATENLTQVGKIKHNLVRMDDFEKRITDIPLQNSGFSPAQFSPRPSRNSSFPEEISHIYSEPQFVGKGGFARVFRTQREDGRVVAVKVPISLDESTGKSFIREISVWQQISHENIIDLYDMNVFPIPYLELEYADGGSLDTLKIPMEIELASRLIFNVAEGLKHAHDQGIAHRDLKPQNILLTGDLTPKITDWGLSKVMAESKSSSRFGFTPIYAAPEQISPKKFGRPDFRTDIYQIGVIFYELITGKVPFEGEDFSEIGFAIISDEPEPPSILNPECSEVDAIILKCLNKQPDDRYQTIAEFQQDLAVYLKLEFTKSLAKSAGDLKRSCIYCGDLVLINAKMNDVEGALKYALDMKNYAGDGWSSDVEDIVSKLDYLAERKQPIGDELMTKINVVLHQLKMGRY